MSVEIRFTQAARKHRVGQTSARHVMAHTTPTETTTKQGSRGWRYVGKDDRGRELEVIAVEIGGTHQDERYFLAIHVMPTHLRGNDSDA